MSSSNDLNLGERPTLLPGEQQNVNGASATTQPTTVPAIAVGRTTSNSNAATATPANLGNLSPTHRDIYTIQFRPRNEELQEAVQHSNGAIFPMQKEIKNIITEWQDRWQSWTDDNSKKVKAFDDGLAFYSTKPYDAASLDTALPPHLDEGWLDQYLAKIRVIQKAAENERVRQQEREDQVKKMRFDGLTEEEAMILAEEMAKEAEEENENGCQLSPNTQRRVMATNDRKVNFANLHDELGRLFFGPVKRKSAITELEDINSTLFPLEGYGLVPLTMQCHDNNHADPLNLLRAEFAKSLAVVSSNETKLSTMIADREQLIAKEKINDAEALTRQVMSLSTDTLHIIYSRFKQSGVAAVDVDEFIQHVSNVTHTTSEKVATARKEADAIKLKCQADLEKLADFLKKQRDVARQEKSIYDARREDNNNRLKQNTHEQQLVWQVIMEQLEKLKGLAQTREELVSDRMLATEKEKERLVINAEIEVACKNREDDLHAVVDNTVQANEYAISIDRLSEQIQYNVNEKQFPEKLHRYQVEEALRFADLYKRFMVFSNKALFLRRQRLDNVKRLIRATEFQIESAAETLDADAPVYRAQLLTLRTTEDALTAEISSLSEQINKEGGFWDEIEAFLDEKNITVEQPPALAVQELQRDILKNHVEAVDVVTNNEQKLLDGEKAYVRKMHNACVAAKEVLQEKRNRSLLASANSPSPKSPQSQRLGVTAGDISGVSSVAATPLKANRQ